MSTNASTRACSLCGATASWVGRQRVLAAHDVDYFLCASCGLLQTEQPHWLAAAYAQPISALDTGAVQRNQHAAQLTALVATLAELVPAAHCLDYGGGHGVLVRMMRDIGLDFRWYDKYADNLFARGFEGSVDEPHALVTAFEVVEHLAHVGPELDRLFAPQPDLVLVGTVLHRGYQPDWWYLMLEIGQHVAFFAPQTMRWIAERFGYDAIVGDEHTLFVRRDFELGAMRRRLLRQIVRRPIAAMNLVALVPAPLRRRLSPYRSLMETDHHTMRAKVP